VSVCAESVEKQRETSKDGLSWMRERSDAVNEARGRKDAGTLCRKYERALLTGRGLPLKSNDALCVLI
jgi:hypothetical protein